MPDELVKRFCEETLDQVKELSADILRIENAERPDDLFEAILRTLHSIKGSARMLGLGPLSELVHAVEDLFSVVTDYGEALDSEHIDKLLSAIDFIEEAIDSVYENAGQPDYKASIDTVHRYVSAFESVATADVAEIAQYAPEIFHALTPQQREDLLHSYKGYAHLYVLDLSFSRISFSTDVRSVHTMLKNAGKLIATTGTTSVPAPGFDLKFLFLHLSNSNTGDLELLFEKFAPEIRELPLPIDEAPSVPAERAVPAEAPVPVSEEKPRESAVPPPAAPVPVAVKPKALPTHVEIELLAEYVPEAHDVLAPQQVELLEQHYGEYEHLYALELSFYRESFSKDVRIINKLLSAEGKLISTTGTTKAPAPGFDLKFLFLVLTSVSQATLIELTGRHAPSINKIPPLTREKVVPPQISRQSIPPVASEGRERAASSIRKDTEIGLYVGYAPEIFQVLGGHQVDAFLNSLSKFEHAYVLNLCFTRTMFTQKVRDITSVLTKKGLLISTTGTSQRPAPGFDLRFLFLFLSNDAAESLKNMFRDHEPAISEIPRNGHQPEARGTAQARSIRPPEERKPLTPEQRVAERSAPNIAAPGIRVPERPPQPAVKQSAPVTREIRKGSPLEKSRLQALQVFAKQAPHILSVLTPQQEDTLLNQYQSYAHVFLLELSFKRASFSQDIRNVSGKLSESGLLLSSTGTVNAPANGYDLRFAFLFLTDQSAAVLEGITGMYAPLILEIETPGEIEGLTPEEEQPVPVVEAPLPAPVAEKKAPEEKPQYDEDFAKLQEWFLDEGEEILKALNTDILSLEQEADPEIIHAIFRSFHNLKGSGGSYNFPYISRIAHIMESFVQPYRSSVEPPDSLAIDKMLRGVDMLSQIFSVCKEGRHNELDITKLEDAIKAVLRGEEVAMPSIGPAKEPPAPEEPETQAPAPVIEAAPAPAAPKSSRPRNIKEPPSALQRAAQERPASARTPDSIRVNIRKLDSIVSTAVELSVAHTAEQHVLEDLNEALESHARLISEWKSIEEKLRQTQSSSHGKVHAMTDVHSKTLSHFQIRLREIYTQIESSSFRRSALATELGNDALQLQLQPLSTLFESFQRIVRDLSKTLNKPTDLVIEDQYVEVDRRIIESLKDPFTHLLRNAIDHGIESPEVRRANNKSERGKITLTARQMGFSFVINISDDGSGIDKEALAQSILERGMATREEVEAMHEADLYAFLFKPGFSTQAKVTDISGRGVGLDVVETNVRKIGGEVQVYSELGRGTTFTIHLPTNLTLSRALLLEVHDEIFSFPVATTERVLALPPAAVEERNGALLTAYGDTFIPVVEIERLLGVERSTFRMRNGLVIKKRDTLLCLSVPRIMDETELITKALPPHLRGNRLISGVNVLSDGRLALVLNPAAITPMARMHTGDRDVRKKSKRRLLVVDDSLIARELLSNILISFDYDVSLARDGKEALQFLKMHVVDLIISDVDMPNMNGYTLTKTLKSDNEFKKIPIIIITAKESNKDRMEGLEFGADEYLFKGSFNQQNLIDTVERLLEKKSA